MAISFYGAVGDFFNRFGSYANLLKEVRVYQLAQFQNMTNLTDGVTAQLDTEPDIQAIMGSSYLGVLQGSGQIALNQATQLAKATINRMVFRDNPQLNQTLTSANLLASIVEVIRQMNEQGATVLKMTVSATPGNFTGVGNGTLVASVVRPQDGLTQENAFAENITVTITNDSYAGTATAGNESYRATGVGIQTDLSAFNWPLGSNAVAQSSVIDGNSDTANGNLLVNSGFDTWNGTGGFLSNWELVTGTLGVTISQETSSVYDGAACVALTGDGSTKVRWRQKFNDTGGTTTELGTYMQYATNVYLRRGAAAPSQGVLRVSLTDVDGAVIQNIAGTDCVLDITLSSLTVNYTAFKAMFCTPDILPDDVYLDIQLTTAIDAGKIVFVDKLGFGLPFRFYPGGPYLAVFAGSVPFLAGDYATCAVANSRGAGGTIDTLQTAWYRLVYPEVAVNELQLPSSTVPSIPDSVI